MVGAVIALSASQACALGEACVRITAAVAPESSAGNDVADLLSGARQRLLELVDRDASAVAAYVALREAGKMLEGQALLCDLPVEMGRLTVAAAETLSAFRPCVAEQVHDDLEMAIVLLKGTASAAMLLLDHALRLFPEQELHLRFEPERVALETAIARLAAVSRIRT
jgi:formiminotetrahydrofolate cyclodeaminase